jgi:outer membrane immunogenic protein
MTKNTLLAGAALLAMLSTPALANDWAGAYVGITGGYATGDSDFTGTGVLEPGIENPNSEGTINIDGTVIGGQIGFNFDLGNGLIGGVVGDYSNANIDGSVCADDDNCEGVDEGHTYALASADWLSTIRGKLGFASEESLVYVTAGIAMADVTSTVTNLDGVFDLSETEGLSGWTVGAGMNFKVAQNIDLGAEYLYVDLGNAEYNYEWPIDVTGGAEGNMTMHVIRASLNYNF